MESFPEVYREICLLRLKYEHLAEVCRGLLKSWPKHESSGRSLKVAQLTKTKETPASADETASSEHEKAGSANEKVEACVPARSDGSSLQEEAGSVEMQLLDEILSKAQKIRASQPEANDRDGSKPAQRKAHKTLAAATASTKLAAQVYKQPVGRRAQGAKAKPTSAATVSSQINAARKASSSSLSASKNSLSGGSTFASRGAPLKLKSTSGVSLSKQAQRKPAAGLRTKSTPSLTQDPQLRSHKVSTTPSANHKRETSSVVIPRERIPVTPSSVPVETAALPKKESSVECQKIAVLREEEGRVELETSKEEDTGFNIQKHGSRLTMPSKYHKLHNARSKVNEYYQSRVAASDPAADHFARRLLPKEVSESSKVIKLQLAKEEYGILKEQLVSITPQEWAVSERGSWQEVLRVKWTLDNIGEHIHTLQGKLQTAATDSSPHHCDSRPEEALPCSPESHFAYPALKDWKELALLEHKLQLQKLEEELMRFGTEVLLQKASQLDRNDRSFTAVIQLMYKLLELNTAPLFVEVDTA